LKRILALAKAYYPHLGGVETIVRSVAEGVIRHGYKTTVLCFGNGPQEEVIEGVEVRRVRPSLSLGSGSLSPDYFRMFKRLAADADLVHIHSPNPAGETAWLFAPKEIRRALPSLCTYQGDPVRPRLLVPAYLALLRAFIVRCSRVAVSSPRLLASSRALGKERERCTVIPLGIKTARFVRASRSPEEIPNATERSKEPISGLKRPRGLFVGRMVYYKGVDVLLRAAALLPRLSLLLVGDGPLRPGLELLARDLGISGRVRFVSPVDDESYPSLFRLADFFVLPSVSPSEAFGLSLAEAMASGLPAVSTELGTGTSYVNLDGETGLVVAPGDPSALAGAMKQLCDDPERAALMGGKAALRTVTMFDEDVMVRAYCDLYRELLAGR
jgi:rhamnosyl/mannosyltransferase